MAWPPGTVSVGCRRRESLQLGEIEQLARDIAGEAHRFRFVQLPFNLAMTEALTLGNQILQEKRKR